MKKGREESDAIFHEPPPARLYRYKSLSSTEQKAWVRDIIQKDEFFWPSPTTFNDPFDFLPIVKMPSQTRQVLSWILWIERLAPLSRGQRLTYLAGRWRSLEPTMFNERLRWLSLQKLHLKLECACGRSVVWSPDKLSTFPDEMTSHRLQAQAYCSDCGERPTVTPWIMRPASMFDRQEKLVPYVRRLYRNGEMVEAPED